MKEKDLFKMVIDDFEFNEIDSKIDSIKNNIINNTLGKKTIKTSRRNKIILVFSLIAVIILATITVYAAINYNYYKNGEKLLNELGIDPGSLSRAVVIKIFKDIRLEEFKEPVTIEVLTKRHNEVFGTNFSEENIETLFKRLFETEVMIDYKPNKRTKKITSETLKQIKPNMTYREIENNLGPTLQILRDFYHLQYVVDETNVLYLSFADRDDICPYSGEELLNKMIYLPQEEMQLKNPRSGRFEPFDGILVTTSILESTESDDQRLGGITVVCPTFKEFDMIYLDITRDTEIEFSDGTKASIDDLKINFDKEKLIVTVKLEPYMRLSLPPQGTAEKITIKK